MSSQMKLFGKSISEQFEQHRRDHPEFYDRVVRFAREAKERGRRQRYGIAAIFERIRWHMVIERGDDAYKVNNNLRSHYARCVMDREPDLRDFFETRAMRAE